MIEGLLPGISLDRKSTQLAQAAITFVYEAGIDMPDSRPFLGTPPGSLKAFVIPLVLRGIRIQPLEFRQACPTSCAGGVSLAATP